MLAVKDDTRPLFASVWCGICIVNVCAEWVTSFGRLSHDQECGGVTWALGAYLKRKRNCLALRPVDIAATFATAQFSGSITHQGSDIPIEEVERAFEEALRLQNEFDRGNNRGKARSMHGASFEFQHRLHD